LLKRGCDQSRRWGKFGEEIVGGVPNEDVSRVVAKGKFQERFYVVEVKVVRSSGRYSLEKVASNGATACL
jgi:hypothetical protein